MLSRHPACLPRPLACPQASAGRGCHRRPLLCHPAQQAAAHGHTGARSRSCGVRGWCAGGGLGDVGCRSSWPIFAAAVQPTAVLFPCAPANHQGHTLHVLHLFLPACSACSAAAPAAPAAPAACLLQLIITHITSRRASIRRLLAAQGLLLRQPTPGGPDWLDDSGATFSFLRASSGMPARLAAATAAQTVRPLILPATHLSPPCPHACFPAAPLLQGQFVIGSPQWMPAASTARSDSWRWPWPTDCVPPRLAASPWHRWGRAGAGQP